MFDQNMLNELAKMKVDRKRKRKPEEEIEYEVYENDNTESEYDEEGDDIPYEVIEENFDEEYQEDDSQSGEAGGANLANLSEFMGQNNKNKVDPSKVIGETYEENDFSEDDEEAEAKSILIAGKRTLRTQLDKDGNEIPSKFLDETGNLNVVYFEPGKNHINRKSVEEQRLDVKMDALSGLLSKFKSDDEIKAEENDQNVIIMDKQSQTKKDLRKMDEILQIQNDVESKIAMVKQAFKVVSEHIERKAKLPDIDIDITSPDYLRALLNKRSFEDMDVAKIFTLSLFLEDPEKFPTHDTYEQVQYRNSQVGAQCKSIDLKRMITYISSDIEFNNTVESVVQLAKKENMDLSSIIDVFNFKCREVLKTLIVRYLKHDSMDPMNRVNVISIKKDMQFKYRSIDSTKSFIDSLKTKLKAIHPSLKEQLKKTHDQIAEYEAKLHEVQDSIKKYESELTIMIILNIARQEKGYDLNFSKNLPIEKIEAQLNEYNIHLNSDNVQAVLRNGIKEETINNILRAR